MSSQYDNTMKTKKQGKKKGISELSDNLETIGGELFAPLESDINEELEHLQGWREHVRDHDGGAALNYGDY